MKRAAKKDANHKDIVEELERLGYEVIDCSQLKNAFDILVVTNKGNYIVEIKNPKYLPKNYTKDDLIKSLSDGELKCKQRIESTGGKYYIIAYAHEILNIIDNGQTTDK